MAAAVAQITLSLSKEKSYFPLSLKWENHSDVAAAKVAGVEKQIPSPRRNKNRRSKKRRERRVRRKLNFPPSMHPPPPSATLAEVARTMMIAKKSS